MKKLISVSDMCSLCMLHVYFSGCAFCSIPLMLYICVCVCFQIQCPLRECRSIRSGACSLPCYCAALVRVPDVIELLSVWRYNKPKPKTTRGPRCEALFCMYMYGLGLCRVLCVYTILTGHANLTNEYRGVLLSCLLVSSYICPLRTKV